MNSTVEYTEEEGMVMSLKMKRQNGRVDELDDEIRKVKSSKE